MVSDCTIDELMEALAERVPAMVIALAKPVEANECQTVTMSTGNRATCLGLAELAHILNRKKMLAAVGPYDEEAGESGEDDPELTSEDD